MSEPLADKTEVSSSSELHVDKIFVVSVQYSEYKEDDYEPDNYLFKYEEKARNFMREKALELYYDMVDSHELKIEDTTDEEEENYEEEDSDEELETVKKVDSDPTERRERTPTEETKDRCGPYWYENCNSISFGEDRSMGQCYRRAWGLVAISEEKLNTAKQ